ncbi:MAG: FkbM family methyltransferase [Pseudomonadota bacterium]
MSGIDRLEQKKSLKMEIRRRTAPGLALLVRLLLNSPIPASWKRCLWRFAETYISFLLRGGKATTRFGMQMQIRPSEIVQKHIFYFGYWEPNLTRIIRSSGERDGIFVDIGANIGYFSLLSSKYYKKTISIEASPKIYSMLQNNISLNSINNIRSVNKAIGAERGVLPFYINMGSLGGSSLIEKKGSELEAEVAVSILTDFVSPDEMRCVSFIKVDVEGFDHIALRQIFEEHENMHANLRIACEYDPSNPELWPVVSEFIETGFQVLLIQGPYDIDHYLRDHSRHELDEITDAPDRFSDILISRSIKPGEEVSND